MKFTNSLKNKLYQQFLIKLSLQTSNQFDTIVNGQSNSRLYWPLRVLLCFQLHNHIHTACSKRE